jgi:hypothetical protein
MECSGVEAYWHIGKKIFVSRPVRLAYRQQYFSLTTNHQPVSSIFLSEQTSISHQPNGLSVGQADKSRRAEVQDQRDVPATNHLFYVAVL